MVCGPRDNESVISIGARPSGPPLTGGHRNLYTRTSVHVPVCLTFTVSLRECCDGFHHTDEEAEAPGG